MIILLVVHFFRRARSAAEGDRSRDAPVWWAGALTTFMFGTLLLTNFTPEEGNYDDIICYFAMLTLASVPYAFLGGLLRSRLSETELENLRLDAELEARLDELRESRARIVEAGIRRGGSSSATSTTGPSSGWSAWPSICAWRGSRLEEDPDSAAAVLGEAQAELARATEELRELARGIHPAVLSDRGLDGSVDALASRAPLPVDVDAEPRRAACRPGRGGCLFRRRRGAHQRRPARGRDRAEVGIRQEDGRLAGRGPRRRRRRRRPEGGSGLRGLADRVAALDGRSRHRQPARRGTTVRAIIPIDRQAVSRCESSSPKTPCYCEKVSCGCWRRSGFEVVGQAADADDLLRKVRAHKPDVAVVDVRMPPTQTDEGIRAAPRSATSCRAIGVLVLSQYVEEGYASELLADNAEGLGYLLKDRVADVEAFTEAVRRVGAGGSALDPEVVSQLLGRRRRDDPLEALTPREREVLALMAEGRTNASIAEALVVTERAVEKHVTSIFGKLGLTASPDDHRRVLAVLRFLES